jgi:hypothetical protein
MAPSSAEAYAAASMARQEGVSLWALVQGFGMEQTAPTTVWEDTAAGPQMTVNPANRKLTCQIDVRRFYARDLVRDHIMQLVKCARTHNVADALTPDHPCRSTARFSAHWVTPGLGRGQVQRREAL